MIRYATFALLWSCGVAETGVLLCPPGTTSTIDGCLPIAGKPDSGISMMGALVFETDGIDFGRAPVGGAYDRALSVTNAGGAPVTLTLLSIEGDDAFFYSELSAGGSLTLRPGERLDGPVRYLPRGGGDRATFVFRICPNDLCEVRMVMTGFGVQEAFVCQSPETRAGVGTCNAYEVTCINDTDYSVTFDSLGFSGSRSFVVVPAPPVEVQPQGQVPIPIQFCPTEPGQHRAVIELMARVPGGRNTTTYDLIGEGLGASLIQCMPNSVALGPIDLNQIDTEVVFCSALEEVTIDELRFVPGTAPGLVGRLYVGGVMVLPPVDVSPFEAIQVEIEFSPSVEGEFRDELHIEHASGVDVIEVTARSIGDQDCLVDFPNAVDFGSVPVGGAFNASAVLSNTGMGVCQIETIGLGMSTDPAFALLTPVPTVTVLDVGQTIELFRADFFPTRSGQHTGTFLFSIDGDTHRVALIGNGVASSGYTIELIPNRPLSPGAGTPISFNNLDDGFAELSIGFPFAFDGTPVSEVWVGTNGLINFASSSGVSSLNNQPIPTAVEPNSMIAWWWDDLRADHPQGNATVTTSIDGFPGSQVRRFTFLDMAAFGSNTPVFDLEIRLLEQTQEIEVHYGSIMLRGNDMSGSVGWEAANGVDGAEALGCSPSCGAADWPADSILRYMPVP